MNNVFLLPSTPGTGGRIGGTQDGGWCWQNGRTGGTQDGVDQKVFALR
jgi:hypothetical protein